MSKVHIVGGGITGLSVARYLGNYQVCIWERERLGGLCFSFKIEEFTFDLDAHFLHFRSSKIKEEVLSRSKDILVPHKRSSWIYWKRRLIPFPFQRHLSYLPASFFSRILMDLLCYCWREKYGETLSKFILSRYGPTLYKIFFLPYLSKFYKISPDKIPFREVKEFFPQDNISQILEGLLTRRIVSTGYNSIFYYPVSGGIKSFIERWGEGIEKNVKKGEVRKVYWRDRKVEVEGKEIPYDFLVYTSPFPTLFRVLEPFPSNFSHLLPFFYTNSILCYNIGIKNDRWEKVHWVYFPEEEFVFFRVGFYSHIAPLMAPPGCSSIYVETAVSPHETKVDLEERVIDDLLKTGILEDKGEVEVIKTICIPYGYPLFLGERKELDNFQHWLEERGIFLSGRYGRWRYYSMEDCIREGKSVAERIGKILQ